MNYLYKTYAIDYDFKNKFKPTTIIFLHGWGGNKNSFSLLYNYLENYNILTISMPPYFLDFAKKSTLPLTLYDYVEIIKNLITLHSINEIIIVCHSFGFRLTLLMQSFQFNIKAIVVTGGAGIAFEKSFFQQINYNQKIILHKYRLKHNLPLIKNDYNVLDNVDKITFKNVVNKNLKNNINLIHCPVMLFWGKNDKDTPIKTAKFLIKKLLHSKLCISKSNHFAYLNDSKNFINKTLTFLKELK